MTKPSLIALLFCFAASSLSAQSSLDRGNTSYGARNYKSAIAHYERATLENPGNLQLQTNLANSYRYTNKMLSAEKYYKFVCQNPSSPAINFLHYAQVLQANKKYDLARGVFGQYAKQNKAWAEQGQKSCDFAKTQQAMPSAFTVKKEGISHASYDDFAPFFHQNKLYFASARKIKKGAGFSDPRTENFLFETVRGNTGQLSGLKLVKGSLEIAPQNNVAPMAINANQTLAATTFNRFTNGVRHVYDASFVSTGMELSNRTKHQLKSITYIPPGDYFPHVGDQNSASFPAFANDGNAIYFAAYNLPGGFGGFDIWVIYKQGNTWTRPQNLGPNVNTPGDEVSPHLANNGRLFFSSDYHKGFGGFDVFMAKNISNVWKDVRNLGNQVNSSFDDMYFIYDAIKRIGYFSSNRDIYYNVYSAMMTGQEAQLASVVEKEQNIAIKNPNQTNNNNNTIVYNNPNGNNPNGNNPNIYNNNNNTGGNNPAINNNNTPPPPANNNNNLTVTNSGGYRPTSSDNNPPPNNTYTPPANNNNPPANNNVVIGNKPTVSVYDGNTVPCAMNFYIGAVVDASNNRPLKGATVYIKNRKTGEETKVKEPTNHYGEYSVILKPLHDYTIAISKPGFKNLVFDVNTGSGGKKTLLGIRPMGGSPTLERDKYGNVIGDNGPLVDVAKPTEEELLNPIRSTGKTFSYDANGMPTPSTGYLIQALVTNKLTDQQRTYLSQYGNIVTEPRGDKTAYRVGIFADEQHMNEALTEIRKTYSDAFKVPVKLNNDNLGGRIALSSQVIYPLPPKPATPALPVNPTTDNFANNTPANSNPSINGSDANLPPTVKEKTYDNWANNDLPDGLTARGNTPPVVENAAPIVVFKVQLGAYKKAENISFSNVSHLGMIEKTRRGNGLTYFYIADFKTLDEARAARSKAKESGVPAPFIVAFKDGKQVNISDVVN